jgi:aldehyde:ferredoxin oxidoreductase
MTAKRTGGWTGKLLRVDLTSGRITAEPSTPYGETYIGGRGLAAAIAWDEIPAGVGPFDPENRIIFATGPLTGTSAPNSGRSTVCSLSPQAHPYEWFTFSSFGGYWGATLKYAGYDAIVVSGQAPRPVYLWVNDGTGGRAAAELRDADDLWGKGIYATQETLLRRHGKDVRALAIGQAGENRSRISIIASGTSSAAGQGGFGAVMGAKGLKAIAVRGTGGIPLAHPERFTDCTLAVAREMHAPSGCPKWSALDPDLVREYSERFYACTQQCANPVCRLSRYFDNVQGVVHPNRKYSGTITCESSLFGGAAGTIYDWKVGFRGGFELARISQDYGLNHWELGIGMAPWLRRCHEAGELATLDETSFDLDDATCWDALFRKIAFREGIGDALAEGTVRAARLLGMGERYVDDYYTAWGFAGHWDGHGDKINLIVFPYWLVPALQWATATRDPMASGHGYAQNIMNWSPMFSGEDGLGWEAIADVAANVYGTRQAAHPLSGYEAKAYPAIFHGHRSIIKDSVTVDDQAYPRIYSLKTPDHFARAENGMPGPSFEYHMFRLATGMELSEADFEGMAERVFNLERAVQVRNWDRSRAVDEEVIPHFTDMENWINPAIGTAVGLDREKFARLLDEYYTLRGWDPLTGRPTAEKLRELGLVDVADELARLGKIPVENPELAAVR